MTVTTLWIPAQGEAEETIGNARESGGPTVASVRVDRLTAATAVDKFRQAG
ncbi:hypothetical protein MALGJ_05350 [Mycolicibacter algericus]|uniref:Uncharacterized protein n=1 Tax=Mycolicibacter algericus TaxID=1288388 RepID=A0A7I9Y5A4_MYCAL|nr:hypothetical protein MALGJ_05350 [Mycolicibacter algericus]